MFDDADWRCIVESLKIDFELLSEEMSESEFVELSLKLGEMGFDDVDDFDGLFDLLEYAEFEIDELVVDAVWSDEELELLSVDESEVL